MTYEDTYFKLRPPTPTPQDELCSCAGNNPIKLMSALSYNPVHCLDCNLEVPPETIGFDSALAEAIASWRGVYDALDQLWLDSREYEAWAKAELEDISSPVNQRGLKVAAQLNAFRRCYHWLFQDQSASYYEPIRTCPSCAGGR
jgi:predicted  nucleic acid-binding Zn ribbon protein